VWGCCRFNAWPFCHTLLLVTKLAWCGGRMVTLLKLLGLLVLPILFSGCGMPRDPGGTFDRVRREKVVRVGMIASDPWTTVTAPQQVEGTEADLVKRFAKSLEVEIEWVEGSEGDLLEALAERQLDLAVGGLDAKSPYKKLVGLTKPYYTEKLLPVQLPDAAAAEVKDKEVFYTKGQPGHAVWIEMEKGKPRPVEDLYSLVQATTPTVIAAEHWRLEAWGKHADGEPLHETKHVMAVPLGENRWLLQLEKFLNMETEVHRMLIKREKQRLGQAGEGQR